jgi:hypothetical protein
MFIEAKKSHDRPSSGDRTMETGPCSNPSEPGKPPYKSESEVAA